jgi:hypothetical protein
MQNSRLNQANGRLKVSNIGVTILQRGDRLYLQAVLPLRPGSSKLSPCQQQIALSIQANTVGISLAEKYVTLGLFGQSALGWNPRWQLNRWDIL